MSLAIVKHSKLMGYLTRYNLLVYTSVIILLVGLLASMVFYTLKEGVIYQQSLKQSQQLLKLSARHQEKIFDHHVADLKKALFKKAQYPEWQALLETEASLSHLNQVHSGYPDWLNLSSRSRLPVAGTWVLFDSLSNMRSVFVEPTDDGVIRWLSQHNDLSALLSNIAHRPYFVVEIRDKLFLLLSTKLKLTAETAGGYILLAMPMNHALLQNIFIDEQGIAVIFLNKSHQVSASTDDDVLKLSQVVLNERFLYQQKNFADMGLASPLVRMLTLFDKEKVNVQAANFYAAFIPYLWMALLLVLGALGGFSLFLVMRIRKISHHIELFIDHELPFDVPFITEKNEFLRVSRQVNLLNETLLFFVAQQQRWTGEKKELKRLLHESGETIIDLKRIKMLTELLDMGIAFIHENQVGSLNHVMNYYAEQVGGVDLFLLPDGEIHGHKTLLDRHQKNREFDIHRFHILNKDVLQVIETTGQDQPIASLTALHSFPAQNPYPVLKISRDGIVLYWNESAEVLLEKMGVEKEKKLPEVWLVKLSQINTVNVLKEFEVPIGDEFYCFGLKGDHEDNDFYLYGRESTKERMLVEQSNKTDAIFNSVMDAVLVLDVEGAIIQVNTAYLNMMGYSAAEIIGRDLTLLKSDHHHDDEFYDDLWNTLLKDDRWQGEIWSRRCDGGVFPAFFRINTIRNQEEKVVSFVGIMSDITERKKEEAHLSRLAYRDPLTQLPNRLLLQDRLEQAIAQADREQKELGLLFLDLDGFKAINDTLGHDVGDLMLKEVAKRLLSSVRSSDTVSRLGGDEFIVLLKDIPSEDSMAEVAHKITDKLSAPYHLNGKTVVGSASVGIALYPQDSLDPDMLIKKADLAMYKAKKEGKNTYAFSTTAVVTPLKK